MPRFGKAFVIGLVAGLLCANGGLAEADRVSARFSRLNLPTTIQGKLDVAYGEDPAQKLDVYLPAKAHKNLPVIMMVHGGAWLAGNKFSNGVVSNKAKHWVPQGFVFMSANYRLVPTANPVEQADDIAQALAYAQQHASEWGADPRRFILMGHSAGAHLVDLLAADPSIATKQGAKPWLGTISLDSGAIDVPDRMTNPHADFFDQAFGADAEFWKTSSPYHRMTAAPGPMLLVCSAMRQETTVDQANSFAAKAKTLGAKVSVLQVPLRHAAINSNLGLPGQYTDAVDKFVKGLLK